MNTAKRSGFGGVWPVVQRELREGSRRPFNHWLRIGSALAGMALLYANLSLFGRNIPEAAVGARLFSSLHTLLLTLICCIVPTMTADCIARERREGTLGLLFLTGLTPAGIVAGKSLVQSFRALTLWMAVLPILTIPFLTGGVIWSTAVDAVTIEFCAMVLCLAAGLLASSYAKARAMAFALALTLAMVFVILFSQLTPFHFLSGSLFGGSMPYVRKGFMPGRMMGVPPVYYLGNGFGPMSGWGSGPVTITRGNSTFYIVPVASRGRIFSPAGGIYSIGRPLILLGIAAAALLIFMLVIRIAARRVDQSWQDKPPSLKRDKLVKRYGTPVLRGQFTGRMRRALDKNPIAWLQQYSLKARLGKWTLCLTFVILECFFIQGRNFQEMRESQAILLVVLSGVFTFVGVNSFLEEKKTGALELILITPLTVNQIIFGRAWGLWKQFLPAALVLMGFFLAATKGSLLFDRYYYNRGEVFIPLWVVFNGYLALPMFATYFALRVRNLIVAAALTWLALFLAPLMGFGALDQIFWMCHLSTPGSLVFWGVILGNTAFALLVCFLLRHSLSRRIYSF